MNISITLDDKNFDRMIYCPSCGNGINLGYFIPHQKQIIEELKKIDIHCYNCKSYIITRSK